MPPWFIDIASATEIEAKSNGTPPASRTAAAASRANWPRSALHGVTRPSVETTPTKGLARSASDRPRLRRNARCGARSSPSTVMREGSFFVFTHDFFDRTAVRQAELRGAPRRGGFRYRIHDRLQRRIGLEAHLAARLRLYRVPHLLGARGDAREQDGAPRAELGGRHVCHPFEGVDYPRERDARHARARLDRTDVIAPRERLADDRARPAGHRGVRAAGAHHHRRQPQRAAVDVAAARVIVDQHFADELLRAIRH